MEYPKVRDERAWLIQAIFEPRTKIVIKGLFIGPKESVTAVQSMFNAHGQMSLFVDFPDGSESLELKKSYSPYGLRLVQTRVPNTPYHIAGIIAANEMTKVLCGASESDLHDQLFSLIKKEKIIPVLREWVPNMWDRLYNEGNIIELAEFGLDMKIFSAHLPSDFETFLQEDMSEYLRLTAELFEKVS